MLPGKVEGGWTADWKGAGQVWVVVFLPLHLPKKDTVRGLILQQMLGPVTATTEAAWLRSKQAGSVTCCAQCTGAHCGQGLGWRVERQEGDGRQAKSRRRGGRLQTGHVCIEKQGPAEVKCHQSSEVKGQSLLTPQDDITGTEQLQTLQQIDQFSNSTVPVSPMVHHPVGPSLPPLRQSDHSLIPQNFDCYKTE